MHERIRFTLKNGEVKMEVLGVQGPGCYDLSRPYERAFGQVTGDTQTDEYGALQSEQIELTE